MKEEIMKSLAEIAIEISKPFCIAATARLCLSVFFRFAMATTACGFIPAWAWNTTEWIIEHFISENLEKIDADEVFENCMD